jgi:septal ring factor EnvC (AmiA/AmiB activator)
MKTLIDERLKQLQNEYDAGQKMLAELDQKRQTLTTTLLRIEGAMQVLRELTEAEGAPEPAANGTAPSPPAA